jgi:hypothetical protein
MLKHIDWEIVGFRVFIIVMAIILIVATVAMVQSSQNHRECMQHGYTDAVTFTFVFTSETYCTRIVNQTEQVKPLSELRNER